MRLRPLLGAALVVAASLPSTSAVGAGPVTLGQTAASAAGTALCLGNVLAVQDVTVGGASYVAGTAGVVTSWSVLELTADRVAQLKIGHEGPADSYRVLASTERRQLSAGLNTFPTRLPIAAGDTPMLFIPSAATCTFAGGAGDVARLATGLSTEPLNQSLVATNAPTAGRRLNLSVTMEPDVDGDGFGDATQDACPSRATSQGDCAPPETSVTAPRRVVTAKKSAKVKVTLISEPGATFVCVVDARPARSCSTGLALKLRVGTHHLVVAATDAAGNTDQSPATATVKVAARR